MTDVCCFAPISVTDIGAKQHTSVINGNTVYYGNRPVGVGMGAA